MSTLITQTSSHSQLPPFTYTGLLDDVMLRYSDEFKGADFFRKMIAKNVLFGGGIFINDGYLVNHPVAREHLVNERSLLHVMLIAGFVRILTRIKSPGPHAHHHGGKRQSIVPGPGAGFRMD